MRFLRNTSKRRGKARRPADPSFRPHPVDELEAARTVDALNLLLQRRAPLVLELSFRGATIEFFPPPPEPASVLSPTDLEVVRRLGFRPLLTNRALLGSSFDVEVDVWVDPTATVKFEVGRSVRVGATEQPMDRGETANRLVSWNSMFVDGTILTMGTALGAEVSPESGRVTMVGTGDLATDYARFMARREEMFSATRPLLCPDAATYALHFELFWRFLANKRNARSLSSMSWGPPLAGLLTIVVMTAGFVFAGMGTAMDVLVVAAAAFVAVAFKLFRQWTKGPYPQPEFSLR